MKKHWLAVSIVLSLFPATTLYAQSEFTELHDLVPNRCFSAPLTIVSPGWLDIGIESGFDPTTWKSRACIASTRSFYNGSVTDTFTVTVTAPEGLRIARIRYEQTGSRYLERSTYWSASGSGTFSVNDIVTPFTFTTPTLTRIVDLTGQDVQVANVLVTISLSARRNAAFPRVTAAPGSATISVSNAVIYVEYH